ncbi:MAG: hypothetical protein Q4G19_02025, partial [Clostridia bacterium]|nr:hypothetical protein [Clostridia bacterium]
MEKRFTALLLTVCVLLSLCAPASGQDGVCASTEEFVRQIRYHVSSGETAFSVLCDQATYDKLRADGDQPLRTAILQGGMREFSGCEIISRRNVYTFSFSGAVFSTYCYCGSTEEFRTLLDTLAGQQAADFTVQCDPALYRKLMERDCAVLNGINGCCGLYRPQLTYSDDTCSLYYGACEYYPGFRVYQMYISGRESELNGTERELLDTAKDLVNSLKGSTGLETELAIHD